MEERHDREQYFFDEATLSQLMALCGGYERVACVCAPTLGRALAAIGEQPCILDIDERFADVPGFTRFDLQAPSWLGDAFDLVVCDPPFFTVSLGCLFTALAMVTQHDHRRPLLVSYLSRRADAVVRAGQRFGLRATGLSVGYETVADVEKNEIEWFTNLPDEVLRPLR